MSETWFAIAEEAKAPQRRWTKEECNALGHEPEDHINPDDVIQPVDFKDPATRQVSSGQR